MIVSSQLSVRGFSIDDLIKYQRDGQTCNQKCSVGDLGQGTITISRGNALFGIYYDAVNRTMDVATDPLKLSLKYKNRGSPFPSLATNPRINKCTLSFAKGMMIPGAGKSTRVTDFQGVSAFPIKCDFLPILGANTSSFSYIYNDRLETYFTN